MIDFCATEKKRVQKC